MQRSKGHVCMGGRQRYDHGCFAGKEASDRVLVLVAGSWQLSSAAYDDKHNPSSLMAFVP